MYMYMYVYVYCMHVCKCALDVHVHLYIYVSNLTTPGMSASFPVTLVPAPLALSWSPGAAHVEELNTRSAIMHGVLFALPIYMCNSTVQQYMYTHCFHTNPKRNMNQQVWLV